MLRTRAEPFWLKGCAAASCWPRRQLFLETAVIPSSRLTRWAIPTYQASTATLVLATNRAPSDLDPHSAYDPGSQIALGGLFEGLIQVQTGTADTIDPVLAESWTANADKSIWTFFLRPDVTFQDGTPLDAEAARASFERLLTLGLAPSTVLGRFIDDPARITAPDSRTLVFDLGRPQPMFEAAIAAPVGGTVVNASSIARARGRRRLGPWLGANQQRRGRHWSVSARVLRSSKKVSFWSATRSTGAVGRASISTTSRFGL